MVTKPLHDKIDKFLPLLFLLFELEKEEGNEDSGHIYFHCKITHVFISTQMLYCRFSTTSALLLAPDTVFAKH
jgi:hypothetical protein